MCVLSLIPSCYRLCNPGFLSHVVGEQLRLSAGPHPLTLCCCLFSIYLRLSSSLGVDVSLTIIFKKYIITFGYELQFEYSPEKLKRCPRQILVPALFPACC